MGRRIVVALVGALALGLVLSVGALTRDSHAPRNQNARLAPGVENSERLTRSEIAPQTSHGTPTAPAEVKVDTRLLPDVPATPLGAGAPEVEPYEAITRKQGPITPTLAAQEPNMPAPSANFAGLDRSWGPGHPPDTVGDVGRTHYVQAVNASIAIFDKASGARLDAFTFNTLWSGAGTGTPCDTSNRGDPTVVYDPMGDRFFVADFSWASLQNGPYYECIAVSKTGNPLTGGWWLYAIRTDDATHPWLADYPKMAIWPDGLYMTANMYDCLDAVCGSAVYQEVRVWAFDRLQMEAGDVLTRVVVHDVGTNTCGTQKTGMNSCFSLMPSNLRGNLPPEGRENILVAEDGIGFFWNVFKFHPDYTGAGTTFTGPTIVSQTAYNFGGSTTIPSSANNLDSVRDRVMMQAQYRNIDGVESLWINHTVLTGAVGSPYGIQWAQLDVTGGTVAPAAVQEQIYGNLGGDGIHRWMGSLAVDRNGNMALGYSASRAGMHPDIRYNGRLAGDPPGTLPQGETVLVGGGGSQSGSCGGGACQRWGDYSSMTVDPDGCTFWYTTEYYAETGLFWRTRIGSFRYPSPSCNPPTAVRIARFAAARAQDSVVVSWRTGNETETLGFNLWRSTNARTWRKVNARLIGARGRAQGAAYRFVDRTAQESDYHYRLQIVDRAGRRSWHHVEPVAAP